MSKRSKRLAKQTIIKYRKKANNAYRQTFPPIRWDLTDLNVPLFDIKEIMLPVLSHSFVLHINHSWSCLCNIKCPINVLTKIIKKAATFWNDNAETIFSTMYKNNQFTILGLSVLADALEENGYCDVYHLRFLRDPENNFLRTVITNPVPFPLESAFPLEGT